MEGSASEQVFESLNLNPQLFINEILNAVDDMIDGAFDFYEREAPVLLGAKDEDKSKELSQGVSSLRRMIQEVLDKRLSMWEKYCLQHCFIVPEGFSLPKLDSSSESSLVQAGVSDAELDTQLDSLREKLTMVGREAAELTGELYALEKQSILSRACVDAVNNILLEHNSMHGMFQEMIKTSLELRTKMKKLNIRRRGEFECTRLGRICSPNGDHYAVPEIGLYAKLDDLLEFVGHVKGK